MQIDIIWGKVGGFTVNLAVNSVQITPANGDFMVRAPGVYSYFQPRDHLLLKSVSVPFPCCFCSVNADIAGPAPNPLELHLYFNDDLGAGYALTELNAGNGYFGIHCENTEIDLNTKIEYSNLVSSPRKLKFLGGLTGNVCMLNVPVALDTLTFSIWAYLKIQHTLDIVT